MIGINRDIANIDVECIEHDVQPETLKNVTQRIILLRL